MTIFIYSFDRSSFLSFATFSNNINDFNECPSYFFNFERRLK
jgi:hypothetical protein